MAFLNLLSFVFGVLAWVLPLINIFNSKYCILTSLISLSACGMSLLAQIFYISHLVTISDWTALMDTMGTLVFVASVLLIVTIVLNSVMIYLYRQKK